jgi:uncharacterized alpha-E superfamily protein
MPLLCRVAENMFWLSRYIERAIAGIRVVDVTAHLELDAGEELDFWTPLLGQAERPRGAPEVRYYLAFDADNPNSLLSCVRRARSAAREVRESISSEMWEQINTTHLALSAPHAAQEIEESLHDFYRRVRDGLLLIQGLADATMAHDEPWHFLSLGKYLERADGVARAINAQSHLLSGNGDEDTVRWLAVLRSAGSAEAYARYYSLRVEPPRVLEFLLLNPRFPQSVRFSVRAAMDHLEAVALSSVGGDDDISAAPPVRALGLLRARLEHASVDEVLEFGLDEFLNEVQAGILRVSDAITHAYFRYEPQVGRHMAVARAAQIMAAQQQ